MEVKTAKKPFVVGVCARKDPRLCPFVQHITDTLNARHGVMAAPLNGLVGKKDDCCPNVVRQEIRNIELGAIVSLGIGEKLRVYHHGNEAQALYSAGNAAVQLNRAGYRIALPDDCTINMESKTLSALSNEIGAVFAESGLPEIGVRRLQAEIMHFRSSYEQVSLEKRFEMALDGLFSSPAGFDTQGFVKVASRLHEIFAKYDYPMLFVKDKSRKFVPALHIELPESALAFSERLAGVIGNGVEKLREGANL